MQGRLGLEVGIDDIIDGLYMLGVGIIVVVVRPSNTLGGRDETGD